MRSVYCASNLLWYHIDRAVTRPAEKRARIPSGPNTPKGRSGSGAVSVCGGPIGMGEFQKFWKHLSFPTLGRPSGKLRRTFLHMLLLTGRPVYATGIPVVMTGHQGKKWPGAFSSNGLQDRAPPVCRRCNTGMPVEDRKNAGLPVMKISRPVDFFQHRSPRPKWTGKLTGLPV